MQRLRAAECRSERLQRDTHDVVERLLCSECHAAGLRVKPETAAVVVGAKTFAHQARPEPACRTELRDFLEQIAVRREEEGQSWCECVDGEPCIDGLLHVCQRVGKGECEFLYRGRTGFANVVTRNRNRIPQWHFFCTEPEHLGGQRERWRGRIDVCAARDVFLEDVVLHRAGKCSACNTAFFRDDDVHREQRGRGRVDRHARRDLVERNSVEENVHVFDGIDRDTDTPDFPARSGRVGVDAHLRRQVECDGESGLSSFEQQFEALVGRLGRAKARVLPHGPQSTTIHRRLHAACERKDAGICEIACVVDGHITRSNDHGDGDAGGSEAFGRRHV